ncbi:hypothetical protein G5C60_29810 [Streptomyces sp. HC44]|uniref:Uncharacterized protein n=1 Tax=Streptomyces scabichelini TaxID=2711217 RepID=A0A6G4VC59_9ACTN|nr:hypothetical protein [Streptomyces scabichelini]NGO11679.1 hypothetical protein [Streptomyces scabichelini]
MLNSKKIAAAAAAGVLGSFALIGVGAVQAFADGGAGQCADDGMGHVRCSQTSTYKVGKDKAGNVHVVNNSTQSCPTTHSQVTCISDVVVPGKRA